MKIVTLLGGGLGDILRNYLHGDAGEPWCHTFWGKMPSWIAEGNSFRLIIASHNPAAASFFKYVPYIDEVIRTEWMPNELDILYGYEKDNYVPVHPLALNNIVKGVWKKPIIYTTKEERSEIDLICKDPFILIYPFGAYGGRLDIMDYKYLIEELSSHANIVIVGDSHSRFCENGGFAKEEIPFRLPDNVISLVGIDNCRITASVATKAELYIGSWGCYAHPVIASGIPSTVLTCAEVWNTEGFIEWDAQWFMKKCIIEGGNMDIICIHKNENIEKMWDIVLANFVLPNGRLIHWGKE